MATRQIGFQQFFRTSPLVQRFLLPNARPTGRQLGVGSYGSVEEVEINGLVCAGKKLHETLLEAGKLEEETIISKYSDECQLMSDMRHPNIVQFLGLCFLPGSPLPLLVMERLSTSLDSLLESSPNIPLAMKRSILADVSRGLVYLHTHTPPAIHRDLSAKNVLLNSAMTAKISDLGNSRIVDLQPGQLARTLSRFPGTMAYMPPEAFDDISRYGTKLDMFSFGHLGLFTVIQVFPGKLLPSTYPDPNDPDRLIACSEAERRGAYFEQLQGQLGVGHPLERLIRGCMHNAPSRRPSAEEVLCQLEDMKALLQDPYETMNKLEMVRTLQEKDREIQQLQTQGQQPLDHSAVEKTLRKCLQTREEELREREAELEQKNADNRRLTNELKTAQQQNSTHERTLASLQTDLQAREVLLREKEREAREREAEMSRLLRDLRSLQSQLQEDVPLQTQIGSTMVQSLKLPLQLRWKQCQNMPFGIRSLSSVVLNEKVYVGGGNTSDQDNRCTVMVYDLQSGRWSRLPKYRAGWYGMAVVNSMLVLVGGYDRRTGKYVNQLSVWDERSRQWKKDLLPPMTTRRGLLSVCTYNKWLVVAGGVGEDGQINTIELLDTATKQWYTAAPLPQTCSQMTSTVVGDTWYLLGGFVAGLKTKKVFSVSLLDLITQATSEPQSRQRQLWPSKRLPDVPMILSAALALNGSLLALGGRADGGRDNSAIHLYQPDTRKWVKVGDLPRGRSECSCVSLPSGEFLVLGGYSGGYSEQADMGAVVEQSHLMHSV